MKEAENKQKHFSVSYTVHGDKSFFVLAVFASVQKVDFSHGLSCCSSPTKVPQALCYLCYFHSL